MACLFLDDISTLPEKRSLSVCWFRNEEPYKQTSLYKEKEHVCQLARDKEGCTRHWKEKRERGKMRQAE